MRSFLAAIKNKPGKPGPYPPYDAVAPYATGIPAQDTANLQTFFTTLTARSGTSGFIPSSPNPYRLASELVIDGATNVDITCGQGAILLPGSTGSSALKLNNCDNVRFPNGLTFAHDNSSATSRLLWILQSSSCSFGPIRWSWQADPGTADVIGIDNDSGSHWTRFGSIFARADATFPNRWPIALRIGSTGPSFGSNAVHVDVITPASCQVGVLFDGSAGSRILAGNPEDCDTYVKITEAAYSNDSLKIAMPRLDSLVRLLVDCQQISQPPNGSHEITGMAPFPASMVNNPNGIRFAHSIYQALRIEGTAGAGNILGGNSVPAATLGENGDVYFQWDGTVDKGTHTLFWHKENDVWQS